MGGLAFFNSRAAVAPIVAAPEFGLVTEGLNMFSRALLRCGPGSSDGCLACTGWPETVLFLCEAAADVRNSPPFCSGSVSGAWSGSFSWLLILADRLVPVR